MINNPIILTFLRYRYLLENLIKRDLKVKYRRSVLGILWSLLNPVMLMLVMSAVFSKIFHNDIEFFPLYLIIGQTVFSFLNEATSGALFSVVGASALLKKIYIPKYIFPMEKIMFACVNFLFSLVAVLLMMIIYGVPFTWRIILFIIPTVTLLMFCIGLGMMLATVCVFFRDIQYLYSVVIVAWTYLTPLFYPISYLEGHWIYSIVMLNPLTHYVMYFRDVLIYGVVPSVQENLICLGWGLLFSILGVLFFRSKQDEFIMHI